MTVGVSKDVADVIAIWMKNDKEGISLARQLGVDSLRPDKDPGEE